MDDACDRRVAPDIPAASSISGKVACARDNRVSNVHRLLREHLRSPSLRHIKDPYVVIRLAQEIVKTLDRGNSPWLKWTAPRELLAKAATPCWIPVDDLRDHLNRMEGPSRSLNDVDQRLKAFADDSYDEYPRDELRDGCLAIYASEKAEGTEMPAIVGVLRDHIERERCRLQEEEAARLAELRKSEQLAAEQRLLSGADCKWTGWQKTRDVYCRVNARLYRLSPAADKRLELFRVDAVDGRDARLLGRYLCRGAASKAVQQIAYQPEPRR